MRARVVSTGEDRDPATNQKRKNRNAGRFCGLSPVFRTTPCLLIGEDPTGHITVAVWTQPGRYRTAELALPHTRGDLACTLPWWSLSFRHCVPNTSTSPCVVSGESREQPPAPRRSAPGGTVAAPLSSRSISQASTRQCMLHTPINS